MAALLTTSGGDVTVSDMTLTGGVLDAGYGAGVRNAGADLTLARVAVVGNVSRANVSARGGGIDNASGSMVVFASLVGRQPRRATRPQRRRRRLRRRHQLRRAADDRRDDGPRQRRPAAAVGRHRPRGLRGRRRDQRRRQRAAPRDVLGQPRRRRRGRGNLYIQAANPVTMRDSVLVGGSDGNGPENCAGAKPRTLPFNVESGDDLRTRRRRIPEHRPAARAVRPARRTETDSRPPLQGSIAARARAMDCSAGADQRGAALGAACDVGAVERSTDAGASIAASRSPVPAGG